MLGSVQSRASCTSAVVGLAAACSFATVAAHRLGTSFTYDESVTVGYFVQGTTFTDAVTTQIVFNNHPAFTAIAWPIYRLGGTSEVWMRLPAVLAGAACVGVVGWRSARRFGAAVGALAAFLVAANPLFFELSRQARGYSIAALAITTATLLLPTAAAEDASSRLRIAYATLICVALLAHLYAAIAIGAHVVCVLGHDRSRARRWLASCLGGTAVAGVLYSPMLPAMAAAGRAREGELKPSFPREAGEALFGGPLQTVLGVALLMFALRTTRSWRPGASAVAAALLIVWLGLRPYDLYPRFLVWLVPLAAVLVAHAVHRHGPRMAIPAVVLIALSLPATAETTHNTSSIRSVASVAKALEEEGLTTCFSGYFAESFKAYLDPVAHDAEECEITFVQRTDVPSSQAQGRPHTVRQLRVDPSVCALVWISGAGLPELGPPCP